MRDFNKVSPAIWNSARFRALTDDGRLVTLFYLTSGHQNACGCFALPDGYAITDLGWSVERYTSARANAVAGEVAMFDEATSEIFMPRWFRHNPPMNPNHRKAIISAIENIGSEMLREAALVDLEGAEATLRTRQEAKAAAATRAPGYNLLKTPHLTRLK